MTWTNRRTNLILLLLLAALAGVIWRAEVALHAPRTWTRYFHWAVPAAIALLSVWAAAVSRSISRERRLWLGAMIAMTSGLCAALVELALANLYRGGLVLFEKSWDRRLGDLLCIAGLIIIPLYFASTAWLVGLKVTRARLAASLCLFWAALPLAVVVSGLLSGSWTLERAIRDGYPVPLVMVALGVQFLPRAAPPGGEHPASADRLV